MLCSRKIVPATVVTGDGPVVKGISVMPQSPKRIFQQQDDARVEELVTIQCFLADLQEL